MKKRLIAAGVACMMLAGTVLSGCSNSANETNDKQSVESTEESVFVGGYLLLLVISFQESAR